MVRTSGAVRLALASDTPGSLTRWAKAQPVDIRDGRMQLQVSLTPLFVTAD
jgi:hypothetical protein